MKRPIAPLLALALAAACSNNRPAESADASMVEAATDEPNFVPASDTRSDGVSEPPATARSSADPVDTAPAGGTDAAPASPAAGTSTDGRSSDGVPPNNTKVNERDRNDQALTPMDQSGSESDLKITQAIRKAVMADDSLSFTAKNVKIITNAGKVTLRGAVKSASERSAIEAAARKVAGAGKIDNEIEIVQ